MSEDLPARFIIERLGKPLSPRRYLGIDDDGRRCWMSGAAPFATFGSAGAAQAFRRFRMGGHAADAVVVRHTIQ